MGDARIESWGDRLVDGLEQMTQTCALDVADGGWSRLVEVGELLAMTRERVRVRQIEEQAVKRLRRSGWSSSNLLG